jgi:hypothetical protein
LTEQRLIPLEAAGHIGHADDCPGAFHRFIGPQAVATTRPYFPQDR